MTDQTEDRWRMAAARMSRGVARLLRGAEWRSFEKNNGLALGSTAVTRS
jgi:hypothetical protein